jgi:hypothetical protein
MEAVAEKATRERPAEDTPSTAVTEALKGLSDVMLSVSVPARVSRLAAVFVLALLIAMRCGPVVPARPGLRPPGLPSTSSSRPT